MNFRKIAWWFLYIVAAIWLQRFFPGLDAMVPALILCLQEEHRQEAAIVLIIFMLIQEGSGTLPFGASIIWYGFVVICFFVGSRFFMAENLFFVLMLSLALGVGKALLYTGMGSMQPLPLDEQDLLRGCVLQVFFTPIIWLLASFTRRRV